MKFIFWNSLPDTERSQNAYNVQQRTLVTQDYEAEVIPAKIFSRAGGSFRTST
jgi:hypothetical protein